MIPDFQKMITQKREVMRVALNALKITRYWSNEDPVVISAIAAIQQALEAPPESVAAVPGWKLVPIEPTPEMIEASGLRFDIAASAVFKAMLAAAPSAPAREIAQAIESAHNITPPSNQKE